MATAAASATPSAADATTLCQVGGASRSSSSTMPSSTSDERVRHRAGRDRGSEPRCLQRDLLEDDAEQAGDADDVDHPVGEHAADAAAVQQLGRRLRHRGGQARQHACDGSVRTRLERQVAAAAERQQHRADDGDDRDRREPLPVRRVVAPAGRVAEDDEEARARARRRRPPAPASPSPPAPSATSRAAASSSDRHGEDRLDHVDAPAVQCHRLQGPAGDQQRHSDQPRPLSGEMDERAGMPDGERRRLQPAFCCRTVETAKMAAAMSARAVAMTMW